MLRVKNHKAVRLVAKRLAKQKKSRNIITVLAIALTCILFTSIVTMGTTMMQSQMESAQKDFGFDCHACIENLTKDQFTKVKKALKGKDYCYDGFLASANNKEFKTMGVEMRYVDKKTAAWAFAVPYKGRLPKKQSEM